MRLGFHFIHFGFLLHVIILNFVWLLRWHFICVVFCLFSYYILKLCVYSFNFLLIFILIYFLPIFLALAWRFIRALCVENFPELTFCMRLFFILLLCLNLSEFFFAFDFSIRILNELAFRMFFSLLLGLRLFQLFYFTFFSSNSFLFWSFLALCGEIVGTSISYASVWAIVPKPI